MTKDYKLSKKELDKIFETGSVKHTSLPENIKKLFITSHEISLDYHVKVQSAFQKYTDNAVSKTVNLPENANVKDVKKTFMLAHELGCKGLTIYRHKSKPSQVLSFGKK